MPYNNEYNRKLAREIDFNNRQYVTHCDNTGQGTQNYRVQVSNYRGGGKGSRDYNCGDESESDMDGDGMHGGAILGLQAGTVLGGPKSRNELPTRKQIVSTSSLGAPLQTNNETIMETNDTSTATVRAPPPASKTPGVTGSGNVQIGGTILGVKPYNFGTTPNGGKKSYLSAQVIPPSGKMFRAGRFVTVRDLGDDDVSYKKARYESSSEEESSSDEEAEERGKAILKAHGEDGKNRTVLAIHLKGNGSDITKSFKDLKDNSKVEDANKSLNKFYTDIRNKGVEEEADGSGMNGGKRRVKRSRTKTKTRSRPSTSSNRPSTSSNRPSTSPSGPPKKKSLYAKALEGISVVGKTAKEITDLVRMWKMNNPEEAAEYEEDGDYGQPDPEDEDDEPDDEDDEPDDEEDDEEEDDEEEDEEDDETLKKADESNKAISGIAKKVEELGEPKTGPKWFKERDETVAAVEGMKPKKEVLGFKMYSDDPVADWIKAYSDTFGEMTGKTPSGLINALFKLDMDEEDIQMYLSQSQGATKALESRGVSSTLSSGKITPPNSGNKNKNLSCMDAYNNVANAGQTAQPETRPLRKNDTYFGQSGGYFKKTVQATRGKELSVVPKAQMQGSTMSGFGKPMNEKKRKAELRKMGKDELKAQASKHDVKCRGKVNGKTRTLKKGELIDAILKCEYKMEGSGTTLENAKEIKKMAEDYAAKNPDLVKKAPMVAKGKPADKKLLKSSPAKSKRADIVSKVMKEKGLSMIEASKYVKANNLY